MSFLAADEDKTSLRKIFPRIQVEEVLSIVEDSIPIEAIYADYTVSPQEFENKGDIETDELLRRLEDVWNILSATQNVSEQSFREIVRSVKPFSDYPDIVNEFIRGKCNA